MATSLPTIAPAVIDYASSLGLDAETVADLLSDLPADVLSTLTTDDLAAVAVDLGYAR